MPAGLQIFDEKGKLSLDLGTRTFNKLGEFTTQFGQNQSFTDDRVRGKRIAFFIEKVEVVEGGEHGSMMYPDHFIVEDNVIRWDYYAADMDSDWPSRHDLNPRSIFGLGLYKVTYSYGWY